MVAVLVGTILGFLSGLGIGGGSLLILYLTLVLDLETAAARGINLMFFIPSALVAILFRWKQGHIDFRKIFPAILGGCLSALAFCILGSHMDTSLLRKLFGALLITTGLKELTWRSVKC